MPEYGEMLMPVGGGGDNDWSLIRGQDISITSVTRITSYATHDGGNKTLVTTQENHKYTNGDTVIIVSNFGEQHYVGSHVISEASGNTFVIEEDYVATAAGENRVYGPPLASIDGDAFFVVDTDGESNQSTTQHVKASVVKTYMDATPTFTGTTNIVTLGTIGTGTWNATEIGTAKGGTGLTGYTTGDILYASDATTLNKLAAGTEGHVLTMGASTPAWSASSGGVDTSGTPVDNDFAKFTDSDTLEGRSYAEVREDLGLEIGTDVQAYSSILDSLSSLSATEVGYLDGTSDSSINNSKAVIYSSTGAIVCNNLTMGTSGASEFKIQDNGDTTHKIYSAGTLDPSDPLTPYFVQYEEPGGADYFYIHTQANGNTTLATVDVAGHAGNINIVPDGDIFLDGDILKNDSPQIYQKEVASSDGDIDNYGQIWVKNDTPNNLYFTDDTGQDVQLTDDGKVNYTTPFTLYSSFQDDMGTSKHYIPLRDVFEQSFSGTEQAMMMAPFNMTLRRVAMRCNTDISGATWTLGFWNIASGTTDSHHHTLGKNWVTTTGGAQHTNCTFDFRGTVGLGSSSSGGSNAITAGSLISFQLSADTDVTESSSEFWLALYFVADLSNLI